MRIIDATAALHASGQPANTQFARFPFPDHDQIERMLAASRAARSAYLITLVGAAVRVAERVIAGAARGLRRWRAAAQTRAVLARLSDHQLRDIGLTRHDVDVLVGRILAGRTIGSGTVGHGPARPVNRNAPAEQTRRAA